MADLLIKMVAKGIRRAAGARTLIHFSAQSEPFLSLKPPNVSSHKMCSH